MFKKKKEKKDFHRNVIYFSGCFSFHYVFISIQMYPFKIELTSIIALNRKLALYFSLPFFPTRHVVERNKMYNGNKEQNKIGMNNRGGGFKHCFG